MRNQLTLLALLSLFVTAAPSSAQSVLPPETTHGELAMMWWKPEPQITIRSGDLSSDVDLVGDLGIEQERFREIRAVIRPSVKHKIRFAYIPIRYSREGQILNRTIVFRGVTYDLNLPVNTAVNWDLYRFGYEYDFVATRHALIGVIGEVKYNKLDVQLASPVGNEQMERTVLAPTAGAFARVYMAEYVSVTGEFTFFKLDRNDLDGKFYDFDVYGQLNFSRSFAAQIGYRSIKVDYVVDDDEGDLRLKGLYFGGVARF